MSPLELVDDRFEKLATELRAARPVVPEALRERIAALERVEPARERWTFHRPGKSLVLGLAAAALVASFVVAGVTGLSGSGNRRSSSGAAASAPAKTSKPLRHRFERTLKTRAPADQAWGREKSMDLSPVVAGRLQRYEASLRLRVRDVDALSGAAKRAMSLTRRLGGYVSSVQYSTRESRRGGATLVLRVPVADVQAALAGLTSLGTILQQQTGILDVTKRADREAQQIAKLERQLATAGSAEAPAIRHRLQTLRAKHARLLKSARLARITLSLTTPARQAAAAPTRFHRTLDDAGSVLLRELEILLYALVVAGPLLLLGGAVIAGARAQRRRSDARLLERA